MNIIRSYDELPVTFDIPLAAVLTGFSATRLRQLCAAGKFPAYKIGECWRIDKEDYIAWIAAKKAESKCFVALGGPT